jgi:hypothetical protein
VLPICVDVVASLARSFHFPLPAAIPPVLSVSLSLHLCTSSLFLSLSLSSYQYELTNVVCFQVALFTAVTMPGRPKQNYSKDGGDYSFVHVQPVVAGHNGTGV